MTPPATATPRPSRAAEAGPAAVAALTFVLHAACWGRYGPFRDELYFIVCGERLAAGYVDQPPLIAFVARAAHALAGTWVPGLRLAAWAAAALTVYAAGRLARALGGGPFAALLAAVAVAAAPVLAALGHYLTMNAFEPLLWTGLALALVTAVERGDPRAWFLAGPIAAAGVLFKYSMGPWAAGLTAGLLATRARRSVRWRPALAGVALGALLVLPNAAWQLAHGLPFLELARNGQRYKNAAFTVGAFFREQLLGANPVALPLWTGGLAALLVLPALRGARFVGIGAALVLGLLAATGAKPYYLAPLFPVLFAAGAFGAERVLQARPWRAAAVVVLGAAGLATAPLALPLLPVGALLAYQEALGVRPAPLERARLGPLPQVFADQFGWEGLVEAVAAAHASLPPLERARAAVFAQNYGEAAALDVLGRGRGLPPAASGHNNYFLWGVPAGRGDPVLVVGGEDEDCGNAFSERARAGRVRGHPLAMPYERDRSVWICRGATRPLAEIWPAVKHYE